MQDLLKHTPPSHPDHPLLQDALRISQNFLSSINEEITPRRQSMTVKKGEVRVARGGQGRPSPPELRVQGPFWSSADCPWARPPFGALGPVSRASKWSCTGMRLTQPPPPSSAMVGYVRGSPSCPHTLPAQGPGRGDDGKEGGR